MIDELYEQIGRSEMGLEWLKQKRECLIERGESVQGQRALGGDGEMGCYRDVGLLCN